MVKRNGLIAQVTERLREEIVAGRWPLGERIPTEPELAEMTGTARNTVREAVQALVHAGLLERRQGSGTYVIATDEHEVAFGDFFGAARRRDLLELREALEVTAAGLAAQRRTDADVAVLTQLSADRTREWQPEQLAAAEGCESAVSVDTQFHRAIVAASHNAVYLEFYDLLLPLLRQSIAERQGGISKSFDDQHEAIVAAIVAGDGEAARAAARRLFCHASQG